MEKLEQIKKQLQPIFDQFNVELYDLNWHKTKKASTLQVAIMHEDGTMDLDTCADVSEKISELLDTLDVFDDEYFLEVCSPGAERVLRNEKEVAKVVGKKVHLRLKKEIKSIKETDGILKSFENGIIVIEYRDKAATRKFETEYSNIDFIRLAV